MGDSKDMEVWAERVGLTPDTLRILKEEGLTKISQVGLLTPEEIESLRSVVPHPEQATAGLSQLTHQSDCNTDAVRLLMVGKTGGGKSSTANTILGDDVFNSEMRFDSVTDECSLKSSTRDGLTIEIMDSAGLFDTRKGHEEVNLDIVRAVTCLHPGPHAILYVVRIGRFTQEDEEVFTQLMELFDKSLKNYTIVVFTGGDELERSGKKIDEILIKAPDNLKRILNACNNRYVVFNNRATSKHPQVGHLLCYVNMIYVQNGGVPYTCPKYFYISEAVEKEVKERTAKAEQKILKEKRYVQELEAKTRQAEEDVAREKEELQKREQERLKEMMEDEEKRRVELESLKQQLEKQQMNEDQKKQEIEAFLRKLEKEREKEREQHKREIEEEQKNYNEKKRKMEEIIENMNIERKKLEERELHIQEMEMKKLKNGVAENQVKCWISVLTDVASEVAAFLSSRSSGSDVAAGTTPAESKQIPLQHGNDYGISDRSASLFSDSTSGLNPPFSFGNSFNTFGQVPRSPGFLGLELLNQEFLRKMNEKK